MSGKAYVADAGAMVAFLRGEPGHDVFRAALLADGALCYAHGANLAEVFCDFRRAKGEERAQDALQALADVGVAFRGDFDRAFWEDAARIKADYSRVSLADCFGLALARRSGCPFLTTDHHELEAIQAAPSSSSADGIRLFRRRHRRRRPQLFR